MTITLFNAQQIRSYEKTNPKRTNHIDNGAILDRESLSSEQSYDAIP